MLTVRSARPRWHALLVVAALAASGCTSDTPSTLPSPTTVDPAAPTQRPGELTVRIGTIVNSAAPTFERDQRLTDVMRQAAGLTATGASVSVEVTTIDEVTDVESAVLALAGRGVTVVATLCDDATVPAIVDTAVEQGMLAVTACVTLPSPPLVSRSPMFIDLAGMHDSGSAIAEWLNDEGFEGVATISSDLVPDVATSCTSVETGLASAEITLDVSVGYTELVDEPATVLETSEALLSTTDAIVLCALPPAVGDMVEALRQAGLDQPVITPWFADGQDWAVTAGDVHMLTPGSRYNDDPSDAVRALFDELGTDGQAADVVTADTIAMLSAAAQRSGSTGSTRLAEELRGNPFEVVSGELMLSEDGRQTVGRAYRVVEVIGGEVGFDTLTTASS